jgi:hypothetical protein
VLTQFRILKGNNELKAEVKCISWRTITTTMPRTCIEVQISEPPHWGPNLDRAESSNSRVVNNQFNPELEISR